MLVHTLEQAPLPKTADTKDRAGLPHLGQNDVRGLEKFPRGELPPSKADEPLAFGRRAVEVGTEEHVPIVRGPAQGYH
jgi:hypothetical protein